MKKIAVLISGQGNNLQAIGLKVRVFFHVFFYAIILRAIWQWINLLLMSWINLMLI